MRCLRANLKRHTCMDTHKQMGVIEGDLVSDFVHRKGEKM
jgi:hypothetical protein